MGGGKEIPHYVSVEQCDAREEEALFELTGWTIREENHFLKMTDIFILKLKDGPEEDINCILVMLQIVRNNHHGMCPPFLPGTYSELLFRKAVNLC